MVDRTHRVILLNERDNVATALVVVPAGSVLEAVPSRAGREEFVALEDIPYGHKVATDDIPAEGDIIKYGEVIGTATAPIPRGAHVHVHNVSGKRGRGDLPEHAAKPDQDRAVPGRGCQNPCGGRGEW
ncbi:MAG: UxaA family hydrolase [Firmicutes bacterium]|jgi:altronate dehydratase small subunit|nr:UxaA family hydrolase [Bacillota bacterium]